MDGLFGILGLLAIAIGGLLLVLGFYDDQPFNVYQGSVLVGSGLGVLAVSSIIGLLKEIRDAIKVSADLK